jgi:hypothetical protein
MLFGRQFKKLARMPRVQIPLSQRHRNIGPRKMRPSSSWYTRASSEGSIPSERALDIQHIHDARNTALLTHRRQGALACEVFCNSVRWRGSAAKAAKSDRYGAHNQVARAELAALEDRYHRVEIPHERRITLGRLIIAHLRLGQGERTLYVERLLDELWLLTPAARSKRLLDFSDRLDGLP